MKTKKAEILIKDSGFLILFTISSQCEPEEIQHRKQQRKSNEFHDIHMPSIGNDLDCRTEENTPDDRFL